MTVTLLPTTDRKPPAPPRAQHRAGLALEVERRLQRSGYLALREIGCEVHGGIVRLRGHLPTYYLKQVAQAIVADIEGVRQVINQIEVGAPACRPPLGREDEDIRAATRVTPPERHLPPREGPRPSMPPERSWERCWF
jgi:hypothetical protein